MIFLKDIGCCVIVVLLMGFTFTGFTQNINDNDMNELAVPKLNFTGKTEIQRIPDVLKAQAPLHAIDLINWEEYSYKPDVRFRIGHVNDEIWIVFYVREGHVLAQRTATNSSTHKDSCVEFFIDPRHEGSYYNFEFNAIGTTHLAYGPGRGERTFVDPDKIESLIETKSSLGSNPVDKQNGEQEWQLTVVIPAEVFVHSKFTTLSGLKANANFYKCGDETSRPHFLTWSPVNTPRPDFHRPEYFGRLVFE